MRGRATSMILLLAAACGASPVGLDAASDDAAPDDAAVATDALVHADSETWCAGSVPSCQDLERQCASGVWHSGDGPCFDPFSTFRPCTSLICDPGPDAGRDASTSAGDAAVDVGDAS